VLTLSQYEGMFVDGFPLVSVSVLLLGMVGWGGGLVFALAEVHGRLCAVPRPTGEVALLLFGVVHIEQATEVSKAQRGLETVCELEAAVRARDTALAERDRELVSWRRLCVVVWSKGSRVAGLSCSPHPRAGQLGNDPIFSSTLVLARTGLKGWSVV
jgi:hypothetical protein